MPGDSSLIPATSFFSSARSSLISSRDFKVSVQLLDDNETIFQEFKKRADAQVILDYVCEYLNVVEKDYFGLRSQDLSKHRYWIDLNKPIFKQLKGPNIGLRLRVRFYPSDVTVLKEEITRYQLFVQLQRDLLHGRLYCPQNEAALLGGLILQSVVGDYDPKRHLAGYVSEYKLLLKQTAKLEEKIAEAHSTFKGMNPSEAELEFLKKASKLDTYGFDPFTVMDANGQTMYLGVTHRGIYVYHISRMIHHIIWDELKEVDYRGKQLFVVPFASYVSPYDRSAFVINDVNVHSTTNAIPLRFHCPSAKFAKHLWRHILSQQAFFTENDAKHIKPKFSKPRIPLLSRGSTFRFPTSRVLHEIEAEVAVRRTGPQPQFTRYGLQKQAPRQMVTYTSKYHTLPTMHLNYNCNGAIAEDESQEDTEQCTVHSTVADVQEVSGDPIENSDTYELPLSSTPEHVRTKGGTEQKDHLDETALLQNAKPLLTSTPLLETKAFEGEMVSEESSSPNPTFEAHDEAIRPKNASSAVLFAAAKYFFSCLLFLLLISALAIAFFENSPESHPVLDDLRHSFYEPMRRFVITAYDSLSHR